ncbi:hypothetical protein [Geothrix campi]|uniref:hypothetical protein n=1 Tax=Geothrix campi TaxID=2966450 RepID=UPI002148D9E4|nr:hypothetical protein [Geothrix sp. SG10]
MRLLFSILILAAALACGGGSSPSTTSTTPPPPPPPPPVTNPQPVPRAIYRPRVAPAAPGMAAASIGTIGDTFIVAADGGFQGIVGDYQNLRGSIYVDEAGAVSLVGTCWQTDVDGATSPLTLTGTLLNGVLSGTSSAGAFSLAVTTLQDQVVDLAVQTGTWRSTASSNGRVIVMNIHADGSISGFAYANDADATAGKPQVGAYTGTISNTNAGKNCFNIGFSYLPDGSFSYLPSTYGYAYFAADGSLVALTSNVSNPLAGQLSATFVKQ